MHYQELYARTFKVGDGEHYEDMDMSETEAIRTWKKGHKEHKWSSIAAINRRGGVPRAYVLPKSKDLTKGRPIVPYCNHVLAPIYKLVGRGLSYFLCHDPDQNLGFNITRTDQYVKTVKQQSIIAQEQYGENLRW